MSIPFPIPITNVVIPASWSFFASCLVEKGSREYPSVSTITICEASRRAIVDEKPKFLMYFNAAAVWVPPLMYGMLCIALDKLFISLLKVKVSQCSLFHP
jgi:hypothetical protein